MLDARGHSRSSCSRFDHPSEEYQRREKCSNRRFVVLWLPWSQRSCWIWSYRIVRWHKFDSVGAVFVETSAYKEGKVSSDRGVLGKEWLVQRKKSLSSAEVSIRHQMLYTYRRCVEGLEVFTFHECRNSDCETYWAVRWNGKKAAICLDLKADKAWFCVAVMFQANLRSDTVGGAGVFILGSSWVAVFISKRNWRNTSSSRLKKSSRNFQLAKNGRFISEAELTSL